MKPKVQSSTLGHVGAGRPVTKSREAGAFRVRVGRVLRQMREARGQRVETLSDAIGACLSSVRRIESGDSLNPKVVEAYEEEFDDQVLVFLGSDHPSDCAASVRRLKVLERQILEYQQELKRTQIENGKLHGLLRRWKRILVYYKLWHLALPKGQTLPVQVPPRAMPSIGEPSVSETAPEVGPDDPEASPPEPFEGIGTEFRDDGDDDDRFAREED